MPNRLYRLLLITEFLVAVQVLFTFWSQVGGQSHLDLMYWPWKFGIGLAAASLITLMAASPRRLRVWSALLVLVVLLAAAVTHYYHVNEPDEDDSGDEPALTKT